MTKALISIDYTVDFVADDEETYGRCSCTEAISETIAPGDPIGPLTKEPMSFFPLMRMM